MATRSSLKKLLGLLTMSLVLMLANTAAVQASKDFYHIEVTVDSANKLDPSYLSKGLLAALTKLTTSDDLIQHSVIEQALKQPTAYIKRYSYEKKDGQWSLHLVLEPIKINTLLQQAKLEKWSDTPLSILAWVSMQTEETIKLFDTDTPSLSKPLSTTANELGFNVIFPTMDLEETMTLSPQTIQSTPLIKKASQRYVSDNVITIEIKQQEQAYQSNWSLLSQDEQLKWQVNADSLNSLYQQGFEQLKQHLTISVAPSSLHLEITNVNSEQDYQELVKTLKHIEGVKQVELDSVTAESVLYTLEISTKPTTIKRILSQSKALQFEKNVEDTYFYRFTHETKIHT